MGGVRCLGLFPKKNRFFFYAFPKTTRWTNKLVSIEKETHESGCNGAAKIERTTLVVHEDKDKDETITKTETMKKADLLIELQGRDKVKRPTLVVCEQHLLSQHSHLDMNQHHVDQKPKRDFVQQSLFCESVLFEVRYFTHFLK